MFCTECGEKLTLMFASGEGLVPYCKSCGQFRFAQFATAVRKIIYFLQGTSGRKITYCLLDMLKKARRRKKP